MREKVNVFYYPNMVPATATLKKSILLFDEIHFVDRPSFTFGHFGTIATASPLRAYEDSFRKEGVRLYVHAPRDGPVRGEFLEQITNDVNDPEFLRRFQSGLAESVSFCEQQIPPGNYGEVGNQDGVAKELARVDLAVDMRQYAKPMDLFDDKSVHPFSFKTDAERAKSLVTHAVTCSAMLNFALNVGERHGLTPLADAIPYQGLLGAKYARAARMLEDTDSRIQLTDLSFAILDELVQAERLEKLSFKDVISYRKETTTAREAFLEHLAALKAKQGSVARDRDYAQAIKDIMSSEIIPEARNYKNQIDSAYEKLFGALAGSAMKFLGGGGAALQILGDLSWPNLLGLAGLAGAAMGTAAIKARQEVRAVQRECAISYVLGLDG